jgi:hypothetical protein
VDEQPTGKLIAVQIKTGPSHFAEIDDSYIFRGKLTHLDYWTNHSLPVILVAHFIESGETFWVHVDKSQVKRTGKSWTIPIPKTNRLGAGTRAALASVFDGSPAQQRMRKLAIDEPLASAHRYGQPHPRRSGQCHRSAASQRGRFPRERRCPLLPAQPAVHAASASID